MHTQHQPKLLRLLRNLSLLCLAFNQLACGLGSTSTSSSDESRPVVINLNSNNPQDSHDGTVTCQTTYETEDDGCSTMVTCEGTPQDGPTFHPVPCSVVIAQDETTSPNPNPEPTPTVNQGF